MITGTFKVFKVPNVLIEDLPDFNTRDGIVARSAPASMVGVSTFSFRVIKW